MAANQIDPERLAELMGERTAKPKRKSIIGKEKAGTPSSAGAGGGGDGHHRKK